MKKNLFYVAMAAVAMTACTAENDLQEVQKQGQVSPISFTVTSDIDADTRAAWEDADAYKNLLYLKWTKGDLMSLFHGGTVNSTSNAGAFESAQNAIYEAKAGSIDKGLQFTTQSMVVKGQAIMVYPSDTVFDYDKNELYVKIAQKQTKKYILGNIPFISEGIDIATYDEKGKDNTEGYGRNYPIRLRQVGTTMVLHPNYLNKDEVQALVDADEIAPITVSKITLNRTTDKFNVKLPIKLEKATNEDDARWDAAELGNAWNMKSVVKFENPTATGATANSLSFVAEDDEETVEDAQFLLLPQESVMDYTLNAGTRTATAPSDDASVVVETYYGTVTLNDASNKVMYNKKHAENPTDYPKMKVQDALDRVIADTSKKEERNTSAFKGEYVGRHTNQVIDVDLKKLDMSTLHIKSDKQLKDVLLVWKTLGLDPVTLTIDGDATNGRFELSMANVKTLQTDEYDGVVLKPCKGISGEVCSQIVLAGGGEVPHIDFISNLAQADIVLKVATTGLGQMARVFTAVLKYTTKVY